jgi:hypothetical protein
MSSDKPVVVIFDKKAVYAQSQTGIAYQVSAVVNVNQEFTGDPILQDPNVFVYSGGSDSFTRVCSIADMDLLPNTKQDGYYRTNTCKLIFQDIDTALASIPVLRDRVSNLIGSRVELLGKFSSVTEPLEIPYTGILDSSKEQYINSYTQARDSRSSLDYSLEAKNKEYYVAKEKEVSSKEIAEYVNYLSGKLNKVSISLNNITTCWGWLGSTIDSVISGLTESLDPGQISAVSGAIEDSLNQIQVSDFFEVTDGSNSMKLKTYTTALNTSLLSQYSRLSAQYTANSGLALNLKNEVDSLESSRTVALAAESAALGDIQRYCPDVDVSTL